MLSRVASVPRICLSCRLGLIQTRAPLYARTPLSQENWFRQRYYASDSTIQSKERIEALISGRIVERKSKPSSKKTDRRRGGSSGKRGKKKSKKEDDELPDWGLAPRKDAEILVKTKKDASIETTKVVTEELASEEPISEEPIIEQSTVVEPEIEEIGKENIETTISEQEPEVPVTKTATPKRPRKAKHTRPFKDDLVQARHLGVEALGQLIEALVVKNPNEMKKPKKPSRMLEEIKQTDNIDLPWQSVMPKVEEPDELMDEAVQNLDEFRPIDTNTLRIKDFDDLVNQLVDGFTYSQLMAYFHRKLPTVDTTKTTIPKYDWVLEQTYWKASQPDHWELLKPKQRYSIMIIKKIWDVDVQEQVEGLGIMQIWLQPEMFRLISRPSSPVLRSLTTKYLYQPNDERIARNFDENRLDIFARKSIVPVLLARLDEIASSLTSKTVSARHVTEDDLLPAKLLELERITGTLIRYDDMTADLEVSWLADDGRPQSPTKTHGDAAHLTETPADVVLRLLMGPQHKDQQTTVQVLPVLKKSQEKENRFISHQRERRSMSWKEKLQPWARYVSPVGRQSDEESKPSLQFSDNIDLPGLPAKLIQADTVNSMRATFGHVLHSKLDVKGDKISKNPRILSPVVPHPAALTAIGHDDDGNNKPVAQQASIILNFAPSPKQTLKTKGTIPEIQLKLPVDPDTDLSRFSFPPDSTLHGVMPWHVHDVLLPGESVDVRFSQRHLLPLDVDQQSLRDFLAACDFNLLEGRLRTPSHTSFSIPPRWLTVTGRSKSTKSIDIPYQFMGLEIHQVVEVDWHGHTLRYSSIESGLHGGQRQELSLQASPPQDTSKPTLAGDEKYHFLQLVEDIATGRHFSWHQGYQLMQEISDEDLTSDALEQSTEEYPSMLETEEAEVISSETTDSTVIEEAERENEQGVLENLDGESEETNTDADAVETPSSSEAQPAEDSKVETK